MRPTGYCSFIICLLKKQSGPEHRWFACCIPISKQRDQRFRQVVAGVFHSYDSHHKLSDTRRAYEILYTMAFIIVATIFGVACYMKKLYRLITVYLVGNSLFLLLLYGLFHLRNLLSALSLPTSLPTAVFLVFNFGSLGLLALHYECSLRLHQFYLVMLAALTAIFLTDLLADWTVWILLIGMSLWDLFAVLAPCGPLKTLVETVNRRGEEYLPALVYNTSSCVNERETEQFENVEMTVPGRIPSVVAPWDDEEEGELRLGMGDFVFFSLMLANVVLTAPLLTAVACFVSNIAALTIILPIVALHRKAIPALPVPLFCAGAFYFSSLKTLTPFIAEITTRMILI
ncbi:unnamed protein product [Caenorhabditis sp. 36 PRJEB53466]|nr:unnamed protein product [Caenorhabditis sp. 36 PRJEB53466]